MAWALWIQGVSAIVQASSAVVLVAITVRYVRLTHAQLQIQIEPQIDFRIETQRLQLKVENEGTYPVRDLTIESDFAVIGRTKQTGTRKWNDKFWRLNELAPGRTESHSISEVVMDAAEMAATFQKLAQQNQTSSDADGRFRTILRFNLTYCRDVDRRRYSKTVHVFVVRNIGSDAPVLIDPATFRDLDIGDAQ
jgi:hypothetical protein